MTHPIKTPKKLIEVALPLDDINEAAGREKSIRHGHPSTLHLWWARRPLAAARAVIFAQMVNDPGYQQGGGFKFGMNKEKAALERERLFGIIRRLVQWENTNNEAVLEEAREEIRKSWRETCELNRNHPQAAELFNPDKLPAFHDPFAGGGALPLEGQRLGLESYASDLNPVAVLINKAMIEIPPRFAGRAPVGPVPKGESTHRTTAWYGAQGLAEDVRRYGAWMREEAFKRIGHLYPKVDLPKEHGGGKATVIAWLWTRTVKCPNPACGIQMPLLSSFVLCSKKGKEAYLVPKLFDDGQVRFGVSSKAPEGIRDPEKGYKRGMSGIFECISCKSTTTRNYTAEQATSVGLGSLPTAVVCEGKKGRIYLPVENLDFSSLPDIDTTGLTVDLAPNPRDVWCRNFGLMTPADLFTHRQLVTLNTFVDLVKSVHSLIEQHAISAGIEASKEPLEAGGSGAKAYADAVSVYLAFAVDKASDYWSSVCSWHTSKELIRNTFGRQALPMVWDYAETNPFSDSAGNVSSGIEWARKAIELFPAKPAAHSYLADAQRQAISKDKLVSTDPPYYDNIGYADLSDFFYVWLRRSLRDVYPELFATMAVPKTEELVALPYRHGSKEKAETFFLTGMTQAMTRLAEQVHPAFPTTIYYAFKQLDTTDVGTGNTGWETFLEAVLAAGFAISGTWPMRTEMGNRMVSSGTNALASSIVLVCRKRDSNAATVSRRDFLRELKEELGEAVEVMIGGAEGVSPVAPVDLAQAVIGPGMAIFSKYGAVLEADGSSMTVHTALTLINRMLVEGDDFDSDTMFCLGWFDEQGWSVGPFGQADVMARAKGTSVDGVKSAGVVESGGGKVRLLKPAEYPSNWSPEQDNRTPVWEALHQLIRALQAKGEAEAGALLAHMPERSEPIRKLAYRLYTLCERKGWAEEARGYNELITSWHGIEAASHEAGRFGSQALLDV
jgi:putative DNA methylase